ncbi:MAG: hypothetical protein B6245_09340 [Desulfobacteraceae bacterium 4572_88]|nr:MAG: hypothetical protein B6245_09340 [Desulfobacteraceae bacterium 4572_88]
MPARGPQPVRFFNHETHETHENYEHRTFPHFFVSFCFVELGGRLSEKKAGFPACAVFCPAHRYFCIFSCVSCVSWLKKQAAGDIRQFSDRRSAGYPFLEIALPEIFLCGLIFIFRTP